MRTPRRWMQDRVTVRPYLGHGALGPVYGGERTVACAVEAKRRVVTDASGRKVVANTLLILPGDGPDLAPQSEVDVAGRTTHVITVVNRRGRIRVVRKEVALA